MVSGTTEPISGYIVVRMIVEPDEGRFAAYCPDLDVASFGDSRDEAVSNLEDAILLHLNSLTEHGEIWDELTRRKIGLRPVMPEEVPVNANVRIGGSVTPLVAPISAPRLIAV